MTGSITTDRHLAGRHLATEAQDVQAVQVGRVEADPVGGGLGKQLEQGAGPAHARSEGAFLLSFLLMLTLPAGAGRLSTKGQNEEIAAALVPAAQGD